MLGDHPLGQEGQVTNHWLAAAAGSSCWYPQPLVLSQSRNSCPTVGSYPEQVSLMEQLLFPPSL